MEDKDPFAEFGGKTVETKSADPFAEFGGASIPTVEKKNPVQNATKSPEVSGSVSAPVVEQPAKSGGEGSLSSILGISLPKIKRVEDKTYGVDVPTSGDNYVQEVKKTKQQKVDATRKELEATSQEVYKSASEIHKTNAEIYSVSNDQTKQYSDLYGKYEEAKGEEKTAIGKQLVELAKQPFVGKEIKVPSAAEYIQDDNGNYTKNPNYAENVVGREKPPVKTVGEAIDTIVAKSKTLEEQRKVHNFHIDNQKDAANEHFKNIDVNTSHGFLQGISEASRIHSRADDIATLVQHDKKDEAIKAANDYILDANAVSVIGGENKDPKYLGNNTTGWGETAYGIYNSFLRPMATSAAIGTAASTVGTPAAGALAAEGYLVYDAANQAYSQAFLSKYIELKGNGKTDEQNYDEAQTFARNHGIGGGLAMGAGLGIGKVVGGLANIGRLSEKTFTQGIENFGSNTLEKTIKQGKDLAETLAPKALLEISKRAAVEQGTPFAVAEDVKNIALGDENTVGGTAQSVAFPVVMSVFGAMIGKATGGGKTLINNLDADTKWNIYAAAAAEKPEKLLEMTDQMVDKKMLSRDEADKLLVGVKDFREVYKTLPRTDISPDTYKEVFPLLKAKKDLEAKLKETPSAHTEAQIENVDRKVAEVLGMDLTLKEEKRLEDLKAKQSDPEKGLTKTEANEVAHLEERVRTGKVHDAQPLSSAESRKLNTLETKRDGNEKLDKEEKSDLEYLTQRRQKMLDGRGDNVNVETIKGQQTPAAAETKAEKADEVLHTTSTGAEIKASDLEELEKQHGKLTTNIVANKLKVGYIAAGEILNKYEALKPEQKTEKAEESHAGVSVKVDNAPEGNHLNIGMKVGRGDEMLTQEQILSKLPEGVTAESVSVVEGTEPTLSIKTSRKLTDAEMAKLMEDTQQQAIPQLTDGVGVLHDAKKGTSEGWGDFNPDYFVTQDGKKLSEAVLLTPKQKALKEIADAEAKASAPKEYTVDNIKDADTEDLSATGVKVVEDMKRVLPAIGRIVKEGTGNDVKLVVHNNPESFEKAVLNANGSKQDAASSGGFWMSKTGEIHLDINAVDSETGLHEGFHSILDHIEANNPEAIDKLFTQLEGVEGAEDIVAAAKKNYDGDVTQKKEAITDFIAKVADGQIKVDATNIEKVKHFINQALRTVGLDKLAEKFATDLGLDMSEAKDLQELAKLISGKFKKGEGINPSEFGKDGKIVSDKPQFMSFGGYEKNGYEETKEYKDLVKSGHIVENYNIAGIGGRRVYITSPDNMMVGNVTSGGNSLLTGEGGVHFVSKTGHVWAFKASGEPMVKFINAEIKANGVANIVLTKGKLEKTLNTHDGAIGAMHVLEDLMDRGHIGTSVFRKALLVVGKKYGIDFSGTGDTKSIQESLKKGFYGKENSTFENRGNFISDFVAQITQGARGDSRTDVEAIKKALNTDRTLGKDVTLNKDNVKAALGGLFADEMTLNAKTGEAYAVIEVKSPVKSVNIDKEEGGHAAYPNHIVTEDGSRPKLLILDKPRYIGDVANDESNKPVVTKLDVTGKPKYPHQQLGSANTGFARGVMKPVSEISKPQFSKKDKIKDTYYEPHMTESKDKKDYVFFHVSGADKKSLEKGIDSRKFNSTRTSRDEKGLQYGVASYYTKPTDGERMVGGDKYAVHVPKDKVYPMDTDPNGYREAAEKKVKEGTPFREEKIKKEIAESAKGDGFMIAVGEWGHDRTGGETETPAMRADALVPLKPEKEASGLEGEAKKYDSADEFVKAQTIVYHGSSTKLNKFNNKQGTFFTDDMQNADGYAGGENVYEGYLDFKNPLVIDAKGRMYNDLKSEYGKSTTEIAGSVDANKYDGIIFKNIKDSWIDDADYQDPSTIYYAFKPRDSFKSESQLTDIWDKRNEGYKPATTKEIPHPDKEALIAQNKLADFAQAVSDHKSSKGTFDDAYTMAEQIRIYGGIKEGDGVRPPTPAEFKEMTKGLPRDLAKQAKEIQFSKSSGNKKVERHFDKYVEVAKEGIKEDPNYSIEDLAKDTGHDVKDLQKVWDEANGKEEQKPEEKGVEIGTKKVLNDAARGEMGLEPLELPKMKGADENMAEAKKLVDSGEVDPDNVIDELLAHRDDPFKAKISPADEAVLQYHALQLQQKKSQLLETKVELQKRLDADPSDEDAKLDMATTEQTLQKNYDAIARSKDANQIGGNVWSKFGQQRQASFDEKGQLLNSVDRIKSVYGNEMPKYVSEQLDALQKKYDLLEAANAKLVREHTKQAAQQRAQQAVTEAKKAARSVKKEDLEQRKVVIITSIKSKVAAILARAAEKSGGKMNLDSEELPDGLLKDLSKDITDLMSVYAEQGVVRIDEIADKIHDNLKDAIAGLTTDHIKDVIAGKYSDKRPLSDLQKQVNDLRTQARLQGKISELEDGIVSATAKKGESSAEVQSLRKRVAELKKNAKNEYADVSAAELGKQADAVQKKIDAGEFAKQPTVKTLFEKDPEWIKNNKNKANLMFQLRQLEHAALNSQKSWLMRTEDWTNRWGRRVIFFGSSAVYTKLSSAAVLGSFAHRLPEQAVGYALSKIIPHITNNAPIEGAMNPSAEAKFYMEFLNPKKFAQNTWDIAKTGETELSREFGKYKENKHIPVVDLFAADAHIMIKDPVKRATFAAALDNYLHFYDRNGVDYTHPLILESARQAAYNKAENEIFQQSDSKGNAVGRYFNELEKSGIVQNNMPNMSDRVAGNAKYTAASLYHFFVPINTVPLNIMSRIWQGNPLIFSKNLVSALAKNNEIKNGILNLNHEESDIITRQLKKGMIGSAYWTLGFCLAGGAGGLWNSFNKDPKNKEGKRRDGTHSGDLEVGGHEISHNVQHTAQLTALQMGATWRRTYDHYIKDKGASQFEALANATLSVAQPTVEGIPVAQKGIQLGQALTSPYGAKKMGEDLKRRVGVHKVEDVAKLMGY